MPTGGPPTLEDENRKPLADLGLLAKPTRLAIVPWLLVFLIGDATSSHCSAAQRQDRTRRIGVLMAYAEGDRECDRVAPSAGAARETLWRKQIESL